MSADNSPSSSRDTLPFVILAISFIALAGWLCSAITRWQPAPAATTASAAQPSDNSALDRFLTLQIKVQADQRTDIEAAKGKLEDLVRADLPKLDEQVVQSKKIQSGLEKLVLDLLELSKTDADAKAIVMKYNIQQNATPSPAPTP